MSHLRQHVDDQRSYSNIMNKSQVPVGREEFQQKLDEAHLEISEAKPKEDRQKADAELAAASSTKIKMKLEAQLSDIEKLSSVPSFAESKDPGETPSGIHNFEIDDDELLFVDEGEGFQLMKENVSSRPNEESETIDSDMIAKFQHIQQQLEEQETPRRPYLPQTEQDQSPTKVPTLDLKKLRELIDEEEKYIQQ